VADLYTRELPLGLWQQGLSYSAGVPAHVTPPTTTPADWYTVLTVLGLELFASDPTAARGPAQVDLTISP
jgi:hypothetical protein